MSTLFQGEYSYFLEGEEIQEPSSNLSSCKIIEHGPVQGMPYITYEIIVADKTTIGKHPIGYEAIEALVGLGKEKWAGVEPVKYVRELRSG